MTSAEVLAWIFDDGDKKDSDYAGIMTGPFTTKQDVLDKLRQLREKADEKGNKSLNAFFHAHGGNEKVVDHVQDEIDNNNAEWVSTFEAAAAAGEDKDFLQDRLRNESKNDYEDSSITQVQGIIDDIPEEEPEFTSAQAGAIAEVLGVDEDFVQEAGIRSLQQQLEGELNERIESADSEEELDDILSDIGNIPTKAGVSRLKRDVKERRGELQESEDEGDET